MTKTDSSKQNTDTDTDGDLPNSDQAKIAFEQVRDNIDIVDQQLVELIAKRQQLTASVGELKAQLDLPLYVPEREKVLIAKNRDLAEQAEISPDLVEDVIRRIMRDSYSNQNQTRSKVSKSQSKKIVVIGGAGQLGSLFVRLFAQSGYSVSILEKDDWDDCASILSEAEMVMVAVPIRTTEQVIGQLHALNENCLLVDITSIKESPVNAMLNSHRGPVLGLHPMFGPGIENLAKQTIVICNGRQAQKSEWFVELLKIWGANLTFVEPQQHDRLMAIVQVLRHFSTIAYGFHLKEENIDLDKVLELSSPIYRLELMMVGRLFAQDSELYSDIIFSNKKNIPMVRRFLERLMQLLKMLESEDKQRFAKLFNDVASWFGEHSDKFLLESNLLLAKTNDLK